MAGLVIRSSAYVRPELWAGRRVFVTGHTGFKGSWLCLWLGALGATVRGYALAPDPLRSLFAVAEAGRGVDTVLGDVRDATRLNAALREFAPEVLIHLAAQPLVRASYEDPVGTFATNVMGTVNTLEAAREVSSLRAVVIVTTDKCYENREWPWAYREDEAMGGHDPYSGSKGCAELVTSAYRRSFFQGADAPAVATARAGNVVGGGDWSRDRLVPDLIRSFVEGTPARLRNPNAVRPWQHVLEPLSGYLVLAQALLLGQHDAAGAFNFGPWEQDCRPVGWIAEQLARRWGDGAGWTADVGEHPHEANFLKLDISRAAARLGWAPRLNLASTLDLIVAWHRAFEAGADMRGHCLQEIESFSRTRTVTD